MTAREKLTLRDEAQRTSASPIQGRGWGISAERRARLHEYARDMRRNPTEPERVLWSKLQGQQLGGFKFHRQQVVGSTIVDFACPSRWLVVEVDSDTRANPEVDRLRDRRLTDVGIRVVRFASEEVMRDPDGVCEAILTELHKPFDRRQAARLAALSRSSPSSEGQELEGAGLPGGGSNRR